MKQVLFITASLFYLLPCQSQNSSDRGEFASHPNELMYSEKDMNTLRFIVDSLNLRFKTCDLDKTYYSYPQTKVYYINFSSKNNNLKDIIGQIENKASFEQVASRFSSFISTLDSNEVFIRSRTRNGEDAQYYLQGNPGEGYDEVYWDKEKADPYANRAGKWVYDYTRKGKFSDRYSLTCRYFPGEWKQQAIPDQYARLIQYVDCMIDTSASIFLTDKYLGGWFNTEEKAGHLNLKEVADYIDKKMSIENSNNKSVEKLSPTQVAFAMENLKEDAAFRNLLAKTIDDCIKNSTPSGQLEDLVTKLDMYDKALLIKRSYRVMGFCSQDTRPREHARDIAILSAQAHSWDIFLRAHLDIMNDRFERVSDGSYAWNERKTYLKELEELNLNVVDLMLGLALRAENVANNHYYGTIWRMGWALTESKEKEKFEEKAIEMMKDDALDEFNRGLIFLLYKTYVGRLNKAMSDEKKKRLKETVSTFPAFIQTSIQQMAAPRRNKD